MRFFKENLRFNVFLRPPKDQTSESLESWEMPYGVSYSGTPIRRVSQKNVLLKQERDYSYLVEPLRAFPGKPFADKPLTVLLNILIYLNILWLAQDNWWYVDRSIVMTSHFLRSILDYGHNLRLLARGMQSELRYGHFSNWLGKSIAVYISIAQELLGPLLGRLWISVNVLELAWFAFCVVELAFALSVRFVDGLLYLLAKALDWKDTRIAETEGWEPPFPRRPMRMSEGAAHLLMKIAMFILFIMTLWRLFTIDFAGMNQRLVDMIMEDP